MGYELKYGTSFKIEEAFDGTYALTLGIDVTVCYEHTMLSRCYAPPNGWFTGPVSGHIAYDTTRTFCHADVVPPVTNGLFGSVPPVETAPRCDYDPGGRLSQVSLSLAPRSSESFAKVPHPATYMTKHAQQSMRFTTTEDDGDAHVVKLNWSMTITPQDIMHGFHARHFFCVRDSTEVCQLDVVFVELGRDNV